MNNKVITTMHPSDAKHASEGSSSRYQITSNKFQISWLNLLSGSKD